MSIAALLWMVLLLVANGFFVAAEFAYVAARRNVLEQRQGGTAVAAAVRLSRDLSLTLTAAQLGITMATLFLGAVAEPAVSALLEPILEPILPGSENALHSVALVISVAIVVFLHMVIGEMAPKNIAITAPERSAVVMALPFRAFIMVLRPVIALLNGLANVVLRLVRVDPTAAREAAHSTEELATIIAAGHQEGVIEDSAHRLLTGAIVFADRDAGEAMSPRPDVVTVTDETTPAEIEEVMLASGHSRIVVRRGDLDDVVGFVHLKDLLDIDDDAAMRRLDPKLIRPLPVVPESALVPAVLGEMRRRRSHIALVVDEHGSSAGIITLEDIAEEIVGDIRDEHDPRTADVRRTATGYVVSGGLRTDHLAELGLRVPEGGYETVGGFVMDRLGRVPDPGDQIEEGGWILRVRDMAGRRIVEVELSQERPPPS